MNKVLLRFSADWCVPCKALSKTLSEMDLGDLHVQVFDVDEHREETKEFKVRGVPTMILMEDGVETKRLVGVHSKDEILKFIA